MGNFNQWRLLRSRLRLCLLMTLGALEHRNIPQIDRMLKGLVGFVASVALAICQGSQIDRMLEWSRLYRRGRVQGIVDHRVAHVAIICNDFACVADVFAIMATEAPGEVKVADVIRMCLPVGSHLREKVSLKDALNFTDSALNQIRFLRIHISVLTTIKVIQTGINLLNRIFGCFIMLAQEFNRLAFKIR